MILLIGALERANTARVRRWTASREALQWQQLTLYFKYVYLAVFIRRLLLTVLQVMYFVSLDSMYSVVPR